MGRDKKQKGQQSKNEALALPTNRAQLDALLGSKTPKLCSPTEAVGSKPIYIISPDILHSSGAATSRYVEHGPTKDDPVFAFSLLDNRILNDDSKDADREISRLAKKKLSDIAIVGRGRAYENTAKDRRAVCGLFPRQIFEHMSERVHLENVEFTNRHLKASTAGRSYARALGYVHLAKALRKKYNKNKISLLLSRTDEDADVHRYATQHFAGDFATYSIDTTLPPNFPGKWTGHDDETWYRRSNKARENKWDVARPANQGTDPTWAEAMEAMELRQPSKPFLIAVDANALFYDRPDGKTPTKSAMNDYMLYAANTGYSNISTRLPNDVFNEANRILSQAKLPPPDGKWWTQVPMARPSKPTQPSGMPPLWTKDDDHWIGDPSIRLTLYGPSKPKAQVLLVTGDNGMATAAWHYDQPVYQVDEADHTRMFPIPTDHQTMTTVFTQAVSAYEQGRQPGPPQPRGMPQHKPQPRGMPHHQHQHPRGMSHQHQAAPGMRIHPHVQPSQPCHHLAPDTENLGCIWTCLGRTLAPWTICWAPPAKYGEGWSWRWAWKPWKPCSGCGGCGGCGRCGGCGGGCCSGCGTGCCSGCGSGCCGGGCCSSGCGGGHGDAQPQAQMRQVDGYSFGHDGQDRIPHGHGHPGNFPVHRNGGYHNLYHGGRQNDPHTYYHGAQGHQYSGRAPRY